MRYEPSCPVMPVMNAAFHATAPNRCSQHGKIATGKMAGIMGTLLATENAAVVQRETYRMRESMGARVPLLEKSVSASSRAALECLS